MPDFVVTADDGTLFYCAVEPIGSAQQLRWIFHDTRGLLYIGPPLEDQRTADDVRRMVNEWWTIKREFGQAGQNSPTTGRAVGKTSR